MKKMQSFGRAGARGQKARRKEEKKRFHLCDETAFSLLYGVRSNGDQSFYLIKHLLANPLDLHQIVNFCEGMVLAEGHHAGGKSGSDPRQGGQLLFGGRVDIDLVRT